MTTYDFDAPVERHGTDSLKFDRAVSRKRSPDLLSLWVADMDFALPPEVVEPLAERIRHGIFGYTEPNDPYYEAVGNWIEQRYGWKVEQEWFVLTPGVVFALAMAVRAFSEPGEAVLIQQPVYYPFSEVVVDNGRKLVNAPLTYEDGVYSIDFERFEKAIVDNDVKLYLLCSPHNPVGRVWTEDELRRIGDICLAHDVTIVSDEIHMDFNRPGFRHVPFGSLGETYLNQAVICTSAGKTFNLAGLQVSNIFIADPAKRSKFKHEIAAAGYSQLNTMGLLATQEAYLHGAEWHEQLMSYIEGNIQFVSRYVDEHFPSFKFIEPESTYLVWIDCRSLGLFGSELKSFIQDKAGLWLDYGDMFGPDGDGFIRINVATQRSYLEKALDQLRAAVEDLTR